jgi:hypothetical protein
MEPEQKAEPDKKTDDKPEKKKDTRDKSAYRVIGKRKITIMRDKALRIVSSVLNKQAHKTDTMTPNQCKDIVGIAQALDKLLSSVPDTPAKAAPDPHVTSVGDAMKELKT